MERHPGKVGSHFPEIVVHAVLILSNPSNIWKKISFIVTCLSPKPKKFYSKYPIQNSLKNVEASTFKDVSTVGRTPIVVL